MILEKLRHEIEETIPESQVEVVGDGSKFETVVISPAFLGLTTVKRYQMVYAAVGEYITSGTIHALTIKAFTPEEISQV